MDNRASARVRLRWLMALALSLMSSACGTGERAGFGRVEHLRPTAGVDAGQGPGELVEVRGESRRAWRIAEDALVELRLPATGGGRLELAIALAPSDAALPSRVVAVLDLRDGLGETQTLLRQPIDPTGGWQSLAIELPPLEALEQPEQPRQRAQQIELHLETPADAPPFVAWLGEILLLRPGSEPRPPNVVLVTLDTTRADVARDSSVAPHLAKLGDRGIVFDRAWSPATTTSAAHASILTGLPVERHGTMSNRDRLDEAQITLAEALHEQGYQTAASVSVRHLGPQVGFGQGFDRFRPAAPGDAADGRQALEPTLEWLSAWRGDDARPFFLWLHLFDPHTPYGPPDEFVLGEWANRGHRIPDATADPPTFPVFKDGPPVPLDWLAGVSSKEHVDALYRAGVGYADRLLGRLLDRLYAIGERDRTVIVVTADHGEALGEQDVWYQHAGLFPATLRVPLVVALPGGPRGAVSDARVSTLDIAPSVLRLVAAPRTEPSGHDLLASLAEPDPSRRVWFAEIDLQQIGFRDGEVLFAQALRPGQFGVRVDRSGDVPRVVGLNRYRAGASWLFDVNADPALEHNLAGDPGTGSARYRELARRQVAGHASPTRRPDLSPEEEAELRSLGYVDAPQ